MLVIKTDQRYRFSRLEKVVLRALLIIVLLPLADTVLQTHLIENRLAYFAIILICFAVNIARVINVKRLYKISFDEDRQRVIFSFKKLFSSPEYLFLPYKEARLEIIEKQARPSGTRVPAGIWFMKSKRAVFLINTAKDGYSASTLKRIVDIALNLPLPVKKL